MALPEDIITLRDYVDSLFAEKEKALNQAAAERDRAAGVLRNEQQRALSIADTEREKAASALRDALSTAEDEREKAASTLRESLARSISEGDERLREHIHNQVSQINAALVSGELLEVERIRGAVEALSEKIAANMRHSKQVQDSQAQAVSAALNAAKEAVTKAETASEKRFDSVNEFRATLSDQATQFMPRKEYDARHDDLTRQVNEMRDSIANLRTSVAVGPAGLAPLESRAARQDGMREQDTVSRVNTGQMYSLLFGTLGTLVGIGGFVVALILATR